MDVGQARDYLFNLSGLPAMKGIKEHEETLEEISCLLDDVDSFLKLIDQMPDFEPEDREDRKWIEKTKQTLEVLKSYGDKQFLENIAKRL
jgi:Mor family transcriptional regulator